MITQSYLTDLTYKINGACIEVHRIMGAGLLESAYHKCLKEEFKLRNINFKSELRVPVFYKEKEINCDFLCDFLIEDQIVLEIKSVSSLNEIHRAQVLNYINLLQKPKGILVNFNVKNLYHQGQETFVNKYYEMLL
ncbi:GxxExxY protein [Chryseobacterium sp. PBS4-4]|uniref:GxxExxY protein n=1 Tax=Chryseobacterium edaphi TaxID=2976532 RepID=A0ABT2WAH2_9FLAO|nr:GxxExxY protein [Chryseobacterium edaphi]MCU7618989.1 GxxExxY protein [Chryseobacterium edaphi]